MRLVELFDKSVDWEWISDAFAKFYVGDSSYLVEFDIIPGDHLVNQQLHADEELPEEFEEIENEDLVSVEFLNNAASVGTEPHGITGTGNQYIVFSTVIKIIQEFVRENKEEFNYLSFDAKEESRKSLYNKLVRSLTSQYTILNTDDGRTIYIVKV